MSRPLSVLLIAAWLAMPGPVWAQEEKLTPEQIAAIRRDEQAAQARVSAAYGHRQPSEMSAEERRQAIRDQQAAGLAVLEKHGVSDKAYARRTARLSREELAAVSREEKRLEAMERKGRAGAAQQEDEQALAPEDIPIQTGFGDGNPVELESSKDAASVVEQGLPPGAEGEDGAPVISNFEAGLEAAPLRPPAPSAKKKKSKRRK